MPAIMADHNVEGHLARLIGIWTSPDWFDLWEGVDCDIQSFERLGLAPDATDRELWNACQANEIVLLTGNRNEEDEDSLEAVIQESAGEPNFPVLTIADPDRVMSDRNYSEEVAARVLEYLIDLDKVRGAGRLYVP
jgi:hypothetical protein